MEILIILLTTLLFYLYSMIITAIFNVFLNTRFPNSFFDFLKLTYLPYFLFWQYKGPSRLKNSYHD